MKHILIKGALALTLLCAGTVPGFANEPVNVNASGVAIQGYDPVAYFTDSKAVKGDEKFQSSYKGRLTTSSPPSTRPLSTPTRANMSRSSAGSARMGFRRATNHRSIPMLFRS